MSKPVVLITGALTGIGRATAVAFARDGAQIVISGRNQEKGDALAAELRKLGATADFIPADVRKDDEVRALVDRTVKRFGRLDVAVNNAGTEGQPGMLVDQTAVMALSVADRAYVLQSGAIVHSGSAKELSADPALAQAREPSLDQVTNPRGGDR